MNNSIKSFKEFMAEDWRKSIPSWFPTFGRETPADTRDYPTRGRRKDKGKVIKPPEDWYEDGEVTPSKHPGFGGSGTPGGRNPFGDSQMGQPPSFPGTSG